MSGNTLQVRPTKAPEVGQQIGDAWRVRATLNSVDSIPAFVLQADSGARAIGFLLADHHPEPQVGDPGAGFWGTVRRVVLDQEFGRVVVDEIGSGTLLAERIAQGWTIPPAWLERFAERVREYHRLGEGHGQIAPDRIVLAADAVRVAGWGLCGDEADDRRARDTAALAEMSGLSHTSVGPAEPAPADSRLRAAIRSNHLPTLRREIARAPTGADAADELARARDALARLQRRVDERLVNAREMLRKGDPFGAVSACREVITLGAEDQAMPLLRQARRQARDLVRKVPKRRRRGAWVLLALALVGLGIAGLVWRTQSAAPDEISELVAEKARTQGERAVVQMLLAVHARGELNEENETTLREYLRRLAISERERTLSLRRDAMADGSRPMQADEEAERALNELERLPTEPLDRGVQTRVKRLLAKIDAVGSIYRAAIGISADDAVAATDLLLADDPLFGEAIGQ